MMYNFPPQQGWQCPVCGRVMAPYYPFCPCGGNGPEIITTTGTAGNPAPPTSTTCKSKGRRIQGKKDPNEPPGGWKPTGPGGCDE